MLAVEDAVSPLCHSLTHHNCSSFNAPISVELGRFCSSPVPIPSQRDTSGDRNSESETEHSHFVQPWGFPGCQSPKIVPGTVRRQKLAVAGMWLWESPTLAAHLGTKSAERWDAVGSYPCPCEWDGVYKHTCPCSLLTSGPLVVGMSLHALGISVLLSLQPATAGPGFCAFASFFFFPFFFQPLSQRHLFSPCAPGIYTESSPSTQQKKGPGSPGEEAHTKCGVWLFVSPL